MDEFRRKNVYNELKRKVDVLEIQCIKNYVLHSSENLVLIS